MSGKKYILAASGLLLFLLGTGPGTSAGRGLANSVLLSAEAERSSTGRMLLLHFACPIQLLEHVPDRQGDSLLALVRLSPECRKQASVTGALRHHAIVPPELRDLVEDIRFERDDVHGPRILLRFRTPVTFVLKPGSDQRSLLVTLPSRKEEPVPDKGDHSEP